METETTGTSYARQVGGRLRAVRRQKGLSLQDVEAGSRQEFKASVLGAYERGERAISVPRLQRLARYYGVPADRLLPDDDTPPIAIDLTERSTNGRSATGGEPLTIDLTALRDDDDPVLAALSKFVTMIQLQRQDYNGRVLTLRRDDVRALACLVDTDVDGLRRKVEALGLRAGV